MAIHGKPLRLDNKMIWYSFQADSSVLPQQFVQLASSGSSVEIHSSGTAIGLCLSVETTEGTQERVAKIYTAGGSGQLAVLSSNWDGAPSRFEVVDSKVSPVSTGGIGWLIPEFPQAAKVAGDQVRVAIYG